MRRLGGAYYNLILLATGHGRASGVIALAALRGLCGSCDVVIFRKERRSISFFRAVYHVVPVRAAQGGRGACPARNSIVSIIRYSCI
jgi:hypothetical protein